MDISENDINDLTGSVDLSKVWCHDQYDYEPDFYHWYSEPSIDLSSVDKKLGAVCPVCGAEPKGIYNIGRDHWVICREHNVKWYIGSNVFSFWKMENERDWEKNGFFLQNFTAVEPAINLKDVLHYQYLLKNSK